MNKTLKGLTLGALLAASALVAPANALTGIWTQVTPTYVTGATDAKVATNTYWTDLTSGTLTSDNLLLGVRSCITMDFKSTSTTTVDSATVIGYATSPTAPGWPGTISTTYMTAQLVTTSGTHVTVTGAPRVIRAGLIAAAGSGQRTTFVVTEQQGCTR